MGALAKNYEITVNFLYLIILIIFVMEVVKIIFDKLSQYNFLTNILPGTVLCIILKFLVGYNVIPNNYYQAGIVF